MKRPTSFNGMGVQRAKRTSPPAYWYIEPNTVIKPHYFIDADRPTSPMTIHDPVAPPDEPTPE